VTDDTQTDDTQITDAQPGESQTAPAPLDRLVWPRRTERLSLRRVTLDDEAAIWEYRRFDEVSRWGSWHPADRADWHEILGRRLRDQLVIELDGRVVGDLMVRVEDAWAQREVAEAARDQQAELGWTLSPDVGGQGYATEAVREVLRLCFEDLGVRRVVAEAFADNEPSVRLAERIGMRREHHAVADALHRDLGWVDSVGYALLAHEWAARQ
jgi:RimJ/RimL family protein N-acetyltransferase